MERNTDTVGGTFEVAETDVSTGIVPASGDAGPQKTVFIKTYGCQMNVYDSTRISESLEQEGYTLADNADDADLVLVNTCHIREKAAEKVYSAIGRLNKLKKKRANSNRPLTIGVTGCVAQAEGREIFRRAPSVDLVAGPQTYHDIGKMVRQARNGERVLQTEFEIAEKFASLSKAQPTAIKRSVAAFLTVQEGCDKFCTFCVVPYTRGAEVSRPASQILDEAKRLADAGVREITLLGQNVNAWHGTRDGGEWTLGDLLRALADIDGIERLRYTTSHPIDMDMRLIEAHREIGKLMPYLHLPVQSGSDRILKAMNRHHTAAEYLGIIEGMREARPDMAISGDFIVGFPGETEEDFEATMQIVRQVRYASAFSFKYSERPGTPGAELENKVPEEVKSERLTRLQALLNEQQLAFNRGCVGQEIDVLAEKPGGRERQLSGRSPWLQVVNFEGDVSQIGSMVRLRVTHAGPSSLVGEPVS